MISTIPISKDKSKSTVSLDQTAALIAYYQAISNSEKYSPMDVQQRLDSVATFGKEAELRAHQLHLEHLLEHPVPRPGNQRKLTLRRRDRQITRRNNLMKWAKEEISRLTADLNLDTQFVYPASREMHMNY